MTRIKKSRKLGSLGPRKSDSRPEKVGKTPRKTTRKGLTSGARNAQLEAKKAEITENRSNQDPRVGSKTPISLVAPDPKQNNQPEQIKQPQAKVSKQKKVAEPIEAWQQELNELENDQQLQSLLDRYDNQEQLTAQELTELNKKMARHTWLMEKLGLDDMDLDEDEALLDQWENSQLKDEDF